MEDIYGVDRRDRKEKELVVVPRPKSVEVYNRFMGGVDKADMFLSLYRTKLRTRKWYIRTECLFLHEPANLVRRIFYISQKIFNFTQKYFSMQKVKKSNSFYFPFMKH